MGELNRAERLQIMLTPAELRLVDNWRFSRRMPSRAAAIRELLKRGLMADGFAAGADGAMSKDLGLTHLAKYPTSRFDRSCARDNLAARRTDAREPRRHPRQRPHRG